MPSPLDDRGGLFDRTLMLKLNMQLSTDTMRSSLQADWKMLTEERKNILINSSLKPRPADENMLRKIESEENPSNCSCGQVAPKEYNADSSCCARGTELVFTWRKNGDVEVRYLYIRKDCCFTRAQAQVYSHAFPLLDRSFVSTGESWTFSLGQTLPQEYFMNT